LLLSKYQEDKASSFRVPSDTQGIFHDGNHFAKEFRRPRNL